MTQEHPSAPARSPINVAEPLYGAAAIANRPSDTDPDMDKALRHVRQGGGAR